MRRSIDGGDSWTRIDAIHDPDIHDIAVTVNGATTVLTRHTGEIFASTDRGENWRGLGVATSFNLRYCRSLAQKADDPATLFVATGDGAARRHRRDPAQHRRRPALAGAALAGRAEFADLGDSRHTRPIPASSSRAAIMASFMRARMPATAGRNCAANSPKSAA